MGDEGVVAGPGSISAVKLCRAMQDENDKGEGPRVAVVGVRGGAELWRVREAGGK